MMFLNYTYVNNGIYYKNTLYNVMSKLVDVYCICHVKFCFHVLVPQYLKTHYLTERVLWHHVFDLL